MKLSLILYNLNPLQPSIQSERASVGMIQHHYHRNIISAIQYKRQAIQTMPSKDASSSKHAKTIFPIKEQILPLILTNYQNTSTQSFWSLKKGGR